MIRPNSAKPFLYVLVLLALVIAAPWHTVAQVTNDYNAERERAFRLYKEAKYVEALPAFEKLAAANSNDRDVILTLGYLVYGQNAQLKDPAARKQARLRARTLLLKAQELGADDVLAKTILDAVPPDGGEDSPFSTRQDVDEAMREGEAAFAGSDYKKAISKYQRALMLDPQQYYAPLFIGDAYFQLKQPEKAGEWYAQAIRIDPMKETAYRYWSDVLLKSGKMDQSRDKAIDAIIAEPYNRMALNGLIQWGQINRISLAHPKIEQPPPAMQSNSEGSQTTIMIDPTKMDPKSPNYYWSFYDLTRATYKTASFAKDHPDETEYRHCLKEEASALSLVAEIASRDLKSGKVKTLNESLDNLIKLKEAGLIEAYVLFARPDRGIARDYAAYREANRDKLRRYWLEFVIGK